MLTHGGSASAPNRSFADAQVIMTLRLDAGTARLGAVRLYEKSYATG
jgi:hypothetical protein